MIYSANIKTLQDGHTWDPMRTPLKVTKGLVYKIEINFPPGSAGLMGVAIFDGSYSVWPSTIGQWFIGDGIVISFDDMYLKEAAPYQFDIYTYNKDTKYDHSVDVRVGLVSKDMFKARFLPTISNKQFFELLAGAQREREEVAAVQKVEIVKTPFEVLFGKQREE